MASNTIRLIVSLMAMAAFLQVTSATQYEVGVSFGWNVPPNTTFYSEWASSKNFFVGDGLMFQSNGSVSDTVGQLSTQSEYENCMDPPYAFDVPALGWVMPILERSGAYYFLSTADNHCENGQKFAINVSALPRTTSPSSAPSLSYGSVSALLVVAAAMIYY